MADQTTEAVASGPKNLTREQILSLPHGREMDGLVHRVVFGGKADGGFIEHDDGSVGSLQHYSTSLFDALDVEAEITRKGLEIQYGVELAKIFGYDPDLRYERATFSLLAMFVKVLHATPDKRCRAALLTVMEMECSGVRVN